MTCLNTSLLQGTACGCGFPSTCFSSQTHALPRTGKDEGQRLGQGEQEVPLPGGQSFPQSAQGEFGCVGLRRSRASLAAPRRVWHRAGVTAPRV